MTEKRQGWTRRHVLVSGLGMAGAYALGLKTPDVMTYLEERPIRKAMAAVLPEEPVDTGIRFADAIARLVAAGAIDVDKFTQAHADRSPLPEWVTDVLDGRPRTVVLATDTAPYLLNLLWPMGLATRAAFNDASPMRRPDLPSFASTGGWTLGKAPNGAVYFNSVETVFLNKTANVAVREAAEQTFRPCCNNSTFFQDCNHGSAMLGLFELAAAQGFSRDDLLTLAKQANGYWYPQQYVEMALWYDLGQGKSWPEVPAAETVSFQMASASGWRKVVHADLIRRGYIPAQRENAGGGGGCAV